MDRDRASIIARGAIERNLADSVEEDGPDSVFDSAYTLAYDALHDAGYSDENARSVAEEIAQLFAQP